MDIQVSRFFANMLLPAAFLTILLFPSLVIADVFKAPVTTLSGTCYMDKVDNSKDWKFYWSGKCKKHEILSMDLVDGEGILWSIAPSGTYIHAQKGTVTTRPNLKLKDGFSTTWFGITEYPGLSREKGVTTIFVVNYGEEFIPGDISGASKIDEKILDQLPDWAADKETSSNNIKHPVLNQLIQREQLSNVNTTSTLPSQDCSVMVGTWRSTFTTLGKERIFNWKWSVNQGRIVTELIDLNGKLLGSTTLDECRRIGNAVSYKVFDQSRQTTTDVNLELDAAQQSFTGSGNEKKDGSRWTCVGSRDISQTQQRAQIGESETTGISRSFSFKPNKK